MRMAKLNSKLAERSKARMTAGVVLPAVKTQMLKEFEAGEDRPWDVVHPSELSHQDRFCPRAVYLRITEGPLPPQKFDFVRENIFAEGNSIHEKWQARLRAAVPLWGDWECQVCSEWTTGTLEPEAIATYMTSPVSDCDTYSGGHVWEYKEVTLDARDDALLSGHADGAFGNTLVEIKSVGEGTVRIEAPQLYRRHTEDGQVDLKGLWRDITRPFKTHMNQGDIYLWICAQRGLPFTQISYIYESKWNQLVKEFVVEYSEERSLVLVDQAWAVRDAVVQRNTPACRFPGECKECLPYDLRQADEADRAAEDWS